MLLVFLLLLSAPGTLSVKVSLLGPDPNMESDPVALQARAIQLRKQLKNENPPLELYLQMAVTLQQLNHLKPDGGSRIAEAEDAYRRALLRISNVEAAVRVRGNMGALLLESGRAQDALEVFNYALAQAQEAGIKLSEVAGISFNRAKALSTIGSLTEAQAAYMSTAHLSYGTDLSSFAKAVAAMEALPDELLQSTDEAVRQALAMFRRTMREGGGNPDAVLGPDEFSGDGGDGGGASGPEWLSRATPVEISWLSFALHKRLDRNKDVDRAWPHLVRANRLMRSTQAYTTAQDQHALDQIRTVFSGTFGGTGFPDTTPVFIVGLPRSGSTLVETMFAAHSDVWPAGEDTAMAPLTAEVNKRLTEKGANQQAVLHEMGQKYVTQMRALVPPDWRGGGGGGAAGDKPLASGGGGGGGGGAAALGPPGRVVDKMLRNLWLVGYIHLLLPHACILHVARHPVDAGLSCYQQPFGYNGLPWAWDLADIASQINMTWDLQRHWETVLPGRVKVVLYEELVAHPEAVGREVLAHCGLDWQPAVLDFHTTTRTVATASVAQVRQPLYSTSVGRWRRYAEHLQPLKEALGGTIAQYESRLEYALQARAHREKVEAEAAAAQRGEEEEDPFSWWTPEPDDDWRGEL